MICPAAIATGACLLQVFIFLISDLLDARVPGGKQAIRTEARASVARYPHPCWLRSLVDVRRTLISRRLVMKGDEAYESSSIRQTSTIVHLGSDHGRKGRDAEMLELGCSPR